MTQWWRDFLEGVMMLAVIFGVITLWLYLSVLFLYWGEVPIGWFYFRLWIIIGVAVVAILAINFANFHDKARKNANR